MWHASFGLFTCLLGLWSLPLDETLENFIKPWKTTLSNPPGKQLYQTLENNFIKPSWKTTLSNPPGKQLYQTLLENNFIKPWKTTLSNPPGKQLYQTLENFIGQDLV